MQQSSAALAYSRISATLPAAFLLPTLDEDGGLVLKTDPRETVKSSDVADFPSVDLADAFRAIETWKSAQLGWHALRQFDDPGIEPEPAWQRRLHLISRPLRRGFDAESRQFYWQAIAEFDERLVEALWSSRIPISLDHPAIPTLRSAFRAAWLALIDIIERRRAGDWRL